MNANIVSQAGVTDAVEKASRASEEDSKFQWMSTLNQNQNTASGDAESAWRAQKNRKWWQ